jgi:myo-inositol catabolism protein IolC
VFLLAFDHRGVFARTIFGTDGEPTPEQEAQMVHAKSVIYDGVRRARELRPALAAAATAGILVDELYGADVARAAKADGITVVMPVEAPDRDLFTYAYGAAWREHIEAFAPDYAKVLVRWNADGDATGNAEQASRLAELSSWLRATGRQLLFELIVPPTPEQLAAVDGDAERFVLELRPGLILRAIEALQAAGVEPDVWKLEGLDTTTDALAAATAARAGGRAHVTLTILGAGAPEARVNHWLTIAATTPGFIGFAIGRSIWADPIRAHLSGTLDRATAAEEIATNYLRFTDVYRTAASD